MATEAPPAPAPATAAPKPAPATPAPAPVKPAPAAPSGTPRERALARMNATAVKADLSHPNPLSTVEPPAPKGGTEAPAPTSSGTDAPRPGALDAAPPADALEGDDATPAPTKTGDDAPPADAPPMSDADKALAEQLAGKDGKKVSPWKLVKDFKGRLGEVEKENLDLRTRLAAAAKADEAVKRAADIEKRNAELEEEIRYVNFAKSKEFADKYQKPYEDAWATAVSELAELDVLGEDGAPVRKATPKDLLALANMPLGDARKAANQWFGDSADDVMAHRRKVQELSRAQAKALDDARKSGADRESNQTATQQAIVQETTTLWAKHNADIAAKSEFLRPKEGDDEWNGKLDAATKLVDAAFSANATDPRLTPDQRAALVQKHAAVRNRAIAYSPLKVQVARLTKQLAAAQAELAQFKASGTVNGDGAGKDTANGHATPANPMEAARQRMQRSAVPAPAGSYL